jgi:hypothetical protein
MVVATQDELASIRSQLDDLIRARLDEGLTPQGERRYEALLLREAELLTCGRASQRGASVVEYAMVIAMFALAFMAALT